MSEAARRPHLPVKRFTTDFGGYVNYTHDTPFAVGEWQLERTTIQRADVHAGVELGIVLDGSGTQYYDGRSYALRPGDTFFLDAGVPHAICAVGAQPVHTICAEALHESVLRASPRRGDLSMLRPFLAVRAGALAPVARDDGSIREDLQRAWEHYRTREPDRIMSAWGYMVAALIALSQLKPLSRTSPQTPRRTEHEEVVGRALTYIYAHLTEQIGVADIAAYCCLSPSRMTHVFTQVMHTSPIAYRNRLRMERAVELVGGTDRKVDDIAFTCGFRSLSQFHALFRRATGLCPIALRAARPALQQDCG